MIEFDTPPEFERRIEAQSQDVRRFFDLQHPSLVMVEANGVGGEYDATPVAIGLEVHVEGVEPMSTWIGLTLDELTELRNILNDAIVYAEGVLNR